MFTGADDVFVDQGGYGLAYPPRKASRDEVSKIKIFVFVFDGIKGDCSTVAFHTVKRATQKSPLMPSKTKTNILIFETSSREAFRGG